MPRRCLLLLCLPMMAWAEPKVSVQLRDTGYTLGDRMESRATIALAPGQTLDPGSLPPLGRVTPWLELQAVELGEARGAAELGFRWQVFATVESARLLKIPAIELRTRGGRPQVVVIPAHAFHLSPVLPNPLEDTRPRPSLPPRKFDERTPMIAALGSSGFALACLAFWLWLTDRFPGLPRHPGPFTRLSRHLRRRRGELDKPALREIHAAFHAAAGETLYPATLNRLFERAPYLQVVRSDIERFFHASWQHFYAGSGVVPARTETLAWLEQAARAERMARR